MGIFFLVRFVHELHGIAPLIATIVAFVALGVVHQRVLERIQEIDALIAYYERGLARIEDRWAGTGETGEQYIDEAHPYARDLDLFGRGSMFELLCTFRTRAGQDRLAQWLLGPAPPVEVEMRRGAAQELAERTEFREELFTAGSHARIGLRPKSLEQWAGESALTGSRTITVTAIALAILWLGSVVLALMASIYLPVFVLTVVNSTVNARFIKRLSGAIKGAEKAAEDLDLLASVLRIIEKEEFSSERLRKLQRTLESGGIKASDAVRRLDRRTNALEHHENLLIRFVDSFLFYTVLCTLWVESWRSRFGAMIPTWISTVGEAESLAALSCYAFEHPNDVWPEFVNSGPLFEVESLAHPLLPEKQAVRNDVKLGEEMRLIVLSGPNMSGKSTLVRGIGLNAVLAQCGAPVRARRLRLSPLTVGASICVLDSLQGGISRFYAEIKRLKMISNLTEGPIPVLFLLDELFGGTNSHDRLQGSELLVRNFVEHGGIGLVTTHDLALTRIPESMNGRARNCHFNDHLEDGKLVFDFKLKEGIAQSSNALRLMESIGLLKA